MTRRLRRVAANYTFTVFCALAALCLAPACGGAGGAESASDDASLEALVVSAGTPTPAFDPDTLTYIVGPAVGLVSTTITPTTHDPEATLTVNGAPTASGSPSDALALSGGLTPMTVEVTAADGVTQRTYTILFDRSVGGQEGYLKASNAEANDIFGVTVSISGDTLVVGASAEAGDGSSQTDKSAPAAGAAYVYR